MKTRPEMTTFKIARKPADKVLAMRQLVHDTEYDPAELEAAGWPLRWHSPPGRGRRLEVGKNDRRATTYGSGIAWMAAAAARPGCDTSTSSQTTMYGRDLEPSQPNSNPWRQPMACRQAHHRRQSVQRSDR